MCVLPSLRQAEEAVEYQLWKRGRGEEPVGVYTADRCAAAALEVVMLVYRIKRKKRNRNHAAETFRR